MKICWPVVTIQSILALIGFPFLFHWVDNAILEALEKDAVCQNDRKAIVEEVEDFLHDSNVFRRPFKSSITKNIPFERSEDDVKKPNEKKKNNLTYIICISIWAGVSNFAAFFAQTFALWDIQEGLQKLAAEGPTNVYNYQKEGSSTPLFSGMKIHSLVCWLGYALATTGNWIFLIIFSTIVFCSVFELKKMGG